MPEKCKYLLNWTLYSNRIQVTMKAFIINSTILHFLQIYPILNFSYDQTMSKEQLSSVAL
jgi:hypothetical protein